MTGPCRARSAMLLVGWTPSTSVKVQSAGQRLSRFLEKPQVSLLCRPSDPQERFQLSLEWGDLAFEAAAVIMGLEVLPC
jgi:hypothetical protein